jgi:hypothetical protein
MAKQTQTASNPFEDVFENIRRTTETSLEMQQDLMRNWSKMWPGMPGMPGMSDGQAAWVEQVQKFQQEFSRTVSDLARRHREVVDRQYQAAVESLEHGLRVAESTNPEEFRSRVEQLCRKTLECFRNVMESQVKEFQDGMNRWGELLNRAG